MRPLRGAHFSLSSEHSMTFRVALTGPLAEQNRTLIAKAFAAHEIDCSHYAVGEPLPGADLKALVTFSPTLPPQAFDTLDVSEFEKEHDCALAQRFSFSQQAIAAFDAKEGGSIVHVVPAQGIWGRALSASQSTATMAVVALSRSIALDHQDRPVTSNVVAIDSEYDSAELTSLLLYLIRGTGRSMTGQLLGMERKTIRVYQQPRPALVAHRGDGWDQARLADLIGNDWITQRPAETGGESA